MVVLGVVVNAAKRRRIAIDRVALRVRMARRLDAWYLAILAIAEWLSEPE